MLFKRTIFYWCLVSALLFSSCQKEDITGNLDYQTLGSSAKHLLSATEYTRLVVQVNFAPGYEPSDSSLATLKQFLQLYLNKPDGISVYKRQVGSSEINTLTIQDVVAVEKKRRTVYTAGKLMAVHVLIVDGNFEVDDILATSYWNTSYVIFGKTMNGYSGGAGQVSRTRLMAAILCHEMGHLLGLVNQGTPMITNHQENGAHCNNTSCLMNFAIETAQVPGIPGIIGIPLLDANCHNDLKANGGK